MMKRKIFNSLGFVVGPVLGGIVMLAVTSLTTYYISPSEYGKSSMFTAIQGFIASFAYLGYDQAFTREYNEQSDKKKLFMNSIFVPIIISLVISLIIFIFHDEVSKHLFTDSHHFTLVIIFSVLIIFTILERFILMYIRMNEDGVEYSIFTTLIKLMVLIITGISILLGVRDFTIVITSTALGQIITDVLLIIKYRYLFDFNIRIWFDKELIKTMFLFGFPIVIAVSLNSLLQISDRIFLKLYSSYSELGVYSAGLKMAALMSVVQTIFINIWVPISYRWKKENKNINLFQKISEISNVLLANLVLIVTFLSPIITFFLPGSYQDIEYYFPLMIVPLYLSCVSETTNLGIVFSRKTYLNIFISGFALLTNIIFSIYFVKMYGGRGAAFANTMAYLIFFVMRSYFSNKYDFNIRIGQQMVIIVFVILICVLKSVFNTTASVSLIIYCPIFLISSILLYKQLKELKNLLLTD